MMRKITATGFATLLLLLLAGVAMSKPLPEGERGTIRGGVYEDLNGDGRCQNTPLEGKRPVPGVDLYFALAGTTLTLYTGSDGTYGLIPVSQGAWQVEARPDSDLWIVTSPNPLAAPISTEDTLVQTGVDFCVLRIGGPAITSPSVKPAGQGQALFVNTESSTVVQPLTSSERAIVSEALLTNPPAPRPPENIAEIVEMPVDEGAPPAPVWLGYLNLFREIGGLSPLAELEPLTAGSQWHSRYMVVNDEPIAHKEDPANVLFDPAGNQAAINGNIFATTQLEANHIWAANFWASAPFHLVAIIDPQLGQVGYGQHNEDSGTFKMAAVIDVRSALGEGPGEENYPYFFPGDGTETWLVRHSLYEWPDPLTSCPGYSRPSGPPLVLQLSAGSLTPSVTAHAVYLDGQLVESCIFHEANYSNPDPFAQSTGRTILDERDAIVIMPRQPLLGDRTYTVQIESNGQTFNWQFDTVSPPS